MKEAEDLIGQKFGKLTVIERAPNKISPCGANRVRWLCKCDCGNTKIIYGQSLKNGSTRSCGCLNKELKNINKTGGKVIDMTGQIFGRLLVLERAEDHIQQNGRRRVQWKCKCQCGNTIVVTRDRLVSGITKSCGCLQKEYQEQRNHNFYELKEDYYIGYTNHQELFYFDIEDYDKIKKYCWFINKEGYVVTTDNNKQIWMHRLCMDLNDSNLLVDHIGGKNTRNDNRKNNLRVCSNSENIMNTGVRKNNTSGTTGVCLISPNTWNAYIQAYGEKYNLGYFKNKQDAIAARKEAEEKYFGEFRFNTLTNNKQVNNIEDDSEDNKPRKLIF